MSKFHFQQLVKYKNNLIPYLIVGIFDEEPEKDNGRKVYSIVRIDDQAKFLLDEEKTLYEIIGYGLDIIDKVKERELSEF